jgi:hypothetical protein
MTAQINDVYAILSSTKGVLLQSNSLIEILYFWYDLSYESRLQCVPARKTRTGWTITTSLPSVNLIPIIKNHHGAT